jgi:hypothetical protein
MSLRDRFEDILSATNDRTNPINNAVPVTTTVSEHVANTSAGALPPPSTTNSVCVEAAPTAVSPFGSKLVILCLLLFALILGYYVYSYMRRDVDSPDVDALPDAADEDVETDLVDDVHENSDNDAAEAVVAHPQAARKQRPPAPPPVSKDPMFQVLQLHRHEPRAPSA